MNLQIPADCWKLFIESGGASGSRGRPKLVNHRRLSIPNNPSLKLPDWNEALSPSSNNRQLRCHMLVDEVRSHTNRGRSLGRRQRNPREA